MEIQKFIELFGEQFDETDVTTLTAETNFRDIDNWSSLIGLSVIAMVDEEYDVQLKGDDIRNSNTIADIFEIVKSKL